MSTKHFQGTYPGPTKTFMKTNPKYNQSGNNSYDSTPMKENGVKSHQQGFSKRDQSNIDADNANGNIHFGSNVPAFGVFPPGYELNEHYGPPGNG